jgi:hypothetical protein
MVDGILLLVEWRIESPIQGFRNTKQPTKVWDCHYFLKDKILA